MKSTKTFFSLVFIITGLQVTAQDSLFNKLTILYVSRQKNGYVTGTFKALYIVNMKTVEAPAAGSLNVEFQHRFGTINSGIL